MTTEEREKLEYIFNKNYALLLAEGDKAKRAYYRGKGKGVAVELAVLGDTLKEEGTRIDHLDETKSIECPYAKVVKES